MCSSPKAPAPPPRTPEAPRMPDVVGGVDQSDADRRRRAVASGQGRSTLLTASRGVVGGTTVAAKTLLGQ